jgi:hypothetical protein
MAASPSSITAIAPGLRDSMPTTTTTASIIVWIRLSYRQSLGRQRRSEKDQADLENQQDRQSRIAKSILPEVDRPSTFIDGNRMVLRSMHGEGFFGTRLQNASGISLKG